MQPTIRKLLSEASNKLQEAGIQSAKFDARLLLGHVLQYDQAQLISNSAIAVETHNETSFLQLIEERCSGKPVHRIVGFREFYGRPFKINAAALEPRPETELLVEAILADYSNECVLQFAEVGVGSGAISCSLLAERKLWKGVATDLSALALECALANAMMFDVAQRLHLCEADCLDGVEGCFDFIVSNPPYIKSADIQQLQREVRLHDPILALDGGEDGFDLYRCILLQAGGLLKTAGRLYLETGHGQHDEIIEIGFNKGWTFLRSENDHSDLERILVFEKPASRT